MTKYQLKKLKLDTIEEYYELILENKANHDHHLAVELFSELTPKQVDAFLNYVAEAYHYEAQDLDEESGGVVLNSELEELCKYFNIHHQ